MEDRDKTGYREGLGLHWLFCYRKVLRWEFWTPLNTGPLRAWSHNPKWSDSQDGWCWGEARPSGLACDTASCHPGSLDSLQTLSLGNNLWHGCDQPHLPLPSWSPHPRRQGWGHPAAHIYFGFQCLASLHHAQSLAQPSWSTRSRERPLGSQHRTAARLAAKSY